MKLLILISISIFFLASCENSSNDNTNDDELVGFQMELIGKWMPQCDIDGFNEGYLLTTQQIKVEFTLHERINTTKVYDANNCTGNIVHEYVSSSTYSRTEDVITEGGITATITTTIDSESNQEVYFVYHVDGDVLHFGNYFGPVESVSFSFDSPLYRQ